MTELLGFILRFDDPRMPESEPVVVRGNYQEFIALQTAVSTYVQDLLKRSPEYFNTTVHADTSVPVTLDSSRLANTDEAVARPESQEVAFNQKIYLEPTDSGLTHKLFFRPLATEQSGTAMQLSVLQLFDLATALDECVADMEAAPVRSYSRPTSAAPSTWANIAALLLLAVGVATAVAVFLNRTNPQRQVAQSPIRSNPSPVALQPSPQPTISTTPSSLPSPQKLPPLPPLTSTTTVPPNSKGVSGLNNSQTNAGLPSGQLPGVIAPPPPPSILTTPSKQDRSQYSSLPESSSEPKTDSTHLHHSKEPRQPAISNSPNSPLANLPPGSNLPVLTPGNPNLGSNTSPTLPNTPGLGNQSTPLPSSSTSPELSKGTAFDSIPQVAEARNYFKQRWEAPPGLTQTLEYSLILDDNGTIQRIIPLGEASRRFIDRTGMPLIGEHFVSPISNGHTPTIRVVLSPDGHVQTFLESD